jgi:hypothetical protein
MRALRGRSVSSARTCRSPPMRPVIMAPARPWMLARPCTSPLQQDMGRHKYGVALNDGHPVRALSPARRRGHERRPDASAHPDFGRAARGQPRAAATCPSSVISCPAKPTRLYENARTEWRHWPGRTGILLHPCREQSFRPSASHSSPLLHLTGIQEQMYRLTKLESARSEQGLCAWASRAIAVMIHTPSDTVTGPPHDRLRWGAG